MRQSWFGSIAWISLVKLSIFGLITIVASHSAYALSSAQSNVDIIGKVAIADAGASPDKIRITINGVHTRTGEEGTFHITVAEAPIYQIAFQGEAIFSSVQTFAAVELQQDTSGTLTVPAIELVAKTEGRVEMIFGGDFMVGRRYLDPQWNEPVLVREETRADDMRALTQHMKPYFETADFASVNLESILATAEPPEHAPKSVVFYTHPDALLALEDMGVDYVSLGNNHSYDYLDDGLKQTFEALEQSPIGHSGAGLNATQAEAPWRISMNNHDYAMLGYVGWKGRVTPNQVAEADKGGAALGTQEVMQMAAADADRKGEISVIQYHGSREYSEGPTELTETRIKAAVDAGADLVIGHHPHVTHGLELYNGKLIAWSLGNFLFDQFFYETHGAMALRVWMDGDQFYRAEVIPLHIKDYRPVPAVADVRNYVLQRVMSLSSERNTPLRLSGGHAVLSAADDMADLGISAVTHTQLEGGKIKRLPTVLSSGSGEDIAKDTGIRFGKDLFFRGGFESHNAFGLNDRSWQIDNAQAALSDVSKGGDYALNLVSAGQEGTITFAPKTFLRVFNKDSYTLTTWIKPKFALEVEAFTQSRPRGMDRYQALETSPLSPIGKASLKAGEWQQIHFDFSAARDVRGRALPMRPVLKFQVAETGANPDMILLDELAIVEWQ
ncbi:CapA family protein [Alterisphingorhabdus coralli]|uniref:CapA family protein n=1 Tax=Alterisphingorhabdus coralli TaxID=3071408 RepID=A0AA97F8F7_9SPHN|nr:CapA family protein [Parasphingorhabdus sp. SCSIO 66989]WOE75898.1 CapA family protein [Parasphingorhabdus sp. SCSIO 66989]